MVAVRVSLSRENFPHSVTRSLQKLLKDEKFVDVTLVCENSKQVKVHKVILSSSSKFFNDILSENPHHHPLVYLKGVNHDRLLKIIEFIYTGETLINESEVNDFVGLGKDLQVEGLVDDHIEEIGENRSILPLTPKVELDCSVGGKIDDSDEIAFAHSRTRYSDGEHQQMIKGEHIPLVPSNKDAVQEKQGIKVQDLMDLYKKKEPELKENVDTQEHEQINAGNFTLPSSSKIILPDKEGKKRIKKILKTYKNTKSEHDPLKNSEAIHKCDVCFQPFCSCRLLM